MGHGVRLTTMCKRKGPIRAGTVDWVNRSRSLICFYRMLVFSIPTNDGTISVCYRHLSTTNVVQNVRQVIWEHEVMRTSSQRKLQRTRQITSMDAFRHLLHARYQVTEQHGWYLTI